MDRVYVMQLVRSFQVGGISRRTFLVRASAALGSLAAANALLAACQPVQPGAALPAPVVDETPDALPEVAAAAAGSMVEYPDRSEAETLTGYLAKPEGEGPWPAVVVLQEWWGLNDHIKGVADRFAEAGYVALAPDLYKGVVTTEPDEARKMVMQLDMAAAVEEIRSAVDFLLAHEDVAGEGAGIVGFCMGGRLVLMTALAADNVGAAVAFYGSPLAPEEAAGVKAPIMGHYGSADGGIPVDGVRAMEAALAEAGIENAIYVYEGAQHAFFNDSRAQSYDPEAAELAWTRTLDWFSTYLGE